MKLLCLNGRRQFDPRDRCVSLVATNPFWQLRCRLAAPVGACYSPLHLCVNRHWQTEKLVPLSGIRLYRLNTSETFTISQPPPLSSFAPSKNKTRLFFFWGGGWCLLLRECDFSCKLSSSRNKKRFRVVFWLSTVYWHQIKKLLENTSTAKIMFHASFLHCTPTCFYLFFLLWLWKITSFMRCVRGLYCFPDGCSQRIVN